jgi:hypothetical protein
MLCLAGQSVKHLSGLTGLARMKSCDHRAFPDSQRIARRQGRAG